MKRRFLYLIILLVLAPLAAGARTIGRDEAKGYASRFFGGIDTSALTLVWTGDNQDTPAFYAFNKRNGGFVIISAEEAVNPVLGYSREGSFSTNGMPTHIREWFSGMEKDINEVKRLKIEPSAAIRNRWRSLGEITRADSEYVLETAQWNQGYPYNNECLTPDGKAVTGCVATAMAIILRYMRYPDHGKGTIPGYVTSTNKYSIEGYSIDDHEYKWDLMPLSNSDVYYGTDEQKGQIAQLIHDCGVMVKMDYTSQGSGAYSEDVPGALSTYMGYSAAAAVHTRSNYSNEEWSLMLTKELRAERPVFYSGTGSGGHAFVIDGFDGNGMFHVNWGWGGHCNGFFTLTLLVDNSTFYAFNQAMVLGLVPDPSGNDTASSVLTLDMNKGLTLTSGTLTEGGTFSLEALYITNSSGKDFKGYVVPALMDGDGNVRELLREPTYYTFPDGYGYYRTFSNCRISVAPGFRDRVVLLYREEGKDTYTAMRTNHDNGTIGQLSVNPYGFINCKSHYRKGDILHLEFLGANGSTPVVRWYFNGTDYGTGPRNIALAASGQFVLQAVIGSGDDEKIFTKVITVE